MTDHIVTECDLQAYVDDQLDTSGRLEVADYLVRHPEVAVRVLKDLNIRDAMRALADNSEQPIGPGIEDIARQVGEALSRSRRFLGLRRFASVAAVLALGVTVGLGGWQNNNITPPASAAVPVLIEEALMSHETAVVRSHMRSQPQVPHFDPVDVRKATRINVPTLPAGWRVIDVQLFPSDYGPSLQIVMDAGKKAPVSLFAARAATELPEAPQTATLNGEVLAYWARKGTVYVLTGEYSQAFLAAHAADLADNQDAG
jgi:anti-sigma factor RsiW